MKSSFEDLGDSCYYRARYPLSPIAYYADIKMSYPAKKTTWGLVVLAIFGITRQDETLKKGKPINDVINSII